MDLFIRCIALGLAIASLIGYLRMLSPRSVSGRLQRGLELFQDGRLEESERLLQSVLDELGTGEDLRSQWIAGSLLGGAMLNQRRYHAACARLEQAADVASRLNPPPPPLTLAPTYCDWVLAECGRRNPDGARAAFDRLREVILRVDPDQANAAAEVLRECGRTSLGHHPGAACWFLEAARDCLDRARTPHAANRVVHAVEMARARLWTSEYNQARATLHLTWLQLAPEQEPALACRAAAGLAACHQRLGEVPLEWDWLKRAERWLDSAASQDQPVDDVSEVEWSIQSADAHRVMGRYAESEEIAARATALADGLREEHQALAVQARATRLRLLAEAAPLEEGWPVAQEVRACATTASESNSGFELAIADVACGQFLLRAEQLGAAIATFRSARERLIDLGAEQGLDMAMIEDRLAGALARHGETREAAARHETAKHLIQRHDPANRRVAERLHLRTRAELKFLEGEGAAARASAMRWLSETGAGCRDSSVERGQVRALLAAALREAGLMKLAAHEEAVADDEMHPDWRPHSVEGRSFRRAAPALANQAI